MALPLPALLVSACADPLWLEAVAALGPEQPDTPAGPLHRAGQPCLVCHSSSGSAPVLVAAGTVYRDPAAQTPSSGVEVILLDARRRSYVTYSNCAGNFFVAPSEFQPQLPLWVSLRYWQAGRVVQVDMDSPMHKDGDCGACHRSPKGPRSAGPVFLTDDPARFSELSHGDCAEGIR